MCRVLEVSRSGFHAWARREPSARAVAEAALSGRIAEIHADSLKTYGSPRVPAELRLQDGVRIGRKRVERLMRNAGLAGQLKRRRGKTTIAVQARLDLALLQHAEVEARAVVRGLPAPPPGPSAQVEGRPCGRPSSAASSSSVGVSG